MTRAMWRTATCLLIASALSSCGNGSKNDATPVAAPTRAHSSSIAVSNDDRWIFVVNADSDSVSVIDLSSRSLSKEISLGSAPPAPDASGAFTPFVMPRALALSPDGRALYVTGERSGQLYAIDVASGAVEASVAIGSEPIGVVVSGDGSSVFVASSQDAKVVRVDAASMKVTAEVTVPPEPWALAWSGDGETLVTTHLLGPGVTSVDPGAMTVRATTTIPDAAPRGDKRLAHGTPRAIYDAAQRPGTSELWVAHAMLGIDTAQPDLDFESTAFPSLALLGGGTSYDVTLSTDAQDVPGVDGSFADVVSGPHALAFTDDGEILLVVDTNSEDVMVVDTRTRAEVTLLRPLPGHMPEGIALSHDGRHAYLDERNSADVAVIDLDRSSGTLALSVDGAPIPRVASDPMPSNLRLGQRSFYSANSDELAITNDHWIACSTCHAEGRTDAVTWKFAQGPRDTPTNAGGMLGTGFLFRTADRNRVQDYWHTIDIEQGGHFDPSNTSQSVLLDAIAAYVNLGIPAPIPPTTDAMLVAKGGQVFAAEGCEGCHAGPRFTDSGSGNSSLDLAGPIVLHDVGTCVSASSGAYPDVAHDDVDGDPREACAFDTPSLTGLASSPPYFHDGSATTIRDAVEGMVSHLALPPLSPDDEDALVEYLRSL